MNKELVKQKTEQITESIKPFISGYVDLCFKVAELRKKPVRELSGDELVQPNIG